jgi:hypothetical protein
MFAFLNRVLALFTTDPMESKVKKSSSSPQKFNQKDKGSKTQENFIDRKNQSFKDSQGNSDFSGSAYNGPGNVDHEKRNSNMNQRNF